MKYKYPVCNIADGVTTGYVILTEEEAKIVAYATNRENWVDVNIEPWSGNFHIAIDWPMEIED